MLSIELFTDGGCLESKGKLYGASAFIIREVKSKKLLLSTIYHGIGIDNNMAEAKAIEHGLEKIISIYNPKNLELKIITDSDFTIKIINERYKIWEKEYRVTGIVPNNNKGKPVKSFFIFKNIFHILKKVKLYRLIKIKSHIPLNKFTSSYNKFKEVNSLRIKRSDYRDYIKYNSECDLKIKECIKNKLCEVIENERNRYIESYRMENRVFKKPRPYKNRKYKSFQKRRKGFIF